MSISESTGGGFARSQLPQASQVIIVSSVMFTFISYWRTAAFVLSDLGSTAYYIGGIVEQAVGPAAPWFILAVMLFSYAVRSVYIESVSLFVRGAVDPVTREALGGLCAKVAEFRVTGVGADRIPFVHDGTLAGHDLFQFILTTIDPTVSLTVAHLPPPQGVTTMEHDLLTYDLEQARQLSREVDRSMLPGEVGPSIVESTRHEGCDLLILLIAALSMIQDDHRESGFRSVPRESEGPLSAQQAILADPEERWTNNGSAADWTKYVVRHTPCPILLALGPPIPDLAEVE